MNEIPLGKSIEKIASDLIQAMPLPCDVQLSIDYDEIYLNNEKNMSCSLLMNEVITNALKHAFENQESGEISIRLTEEEDGDVHLSIADDGIGLPSDFRQQTGSSLGMDLIDSLCQQLDATHRLESSDEGTHFSITFAK
jgi:two-component sensor histidine kinase